MLSGTDCFAFNSTTELEAETRSRIVILPAYSLPDLSVDCQTSAHPRVEQRERGTRLGEEERAPPYHIVLAVAYFGSRHCSRLLFSLLHIRRLEELEDHDYARVTACGRLSNNHCLIIIAIYNHEQGIMACCVESKARFG